MLSAARVGARDQVDIGRADRDVGKTRTTIPVATELRRGDRSRRDRAELLALGRGNMYLLAAHRPGIGSSVVARFTLRGEPLGCAAGSVTATTGTRGVAIEFHHISVGLRELIDDLERLRPALRTGFLAELIDVLVEFRQPCSARASR